MAEAVWLEIGRVTAVDAARRSVRVRPAPGCRADFEDRDRFWLCLEHEAPLLVRVTGVSEAHGLVKLEFTPGISRDMVGKLGRARVLIPADSRAPRPDGLPALREVMGMRVVVSGGLPLGEIVEVIETPAGGAVRLRLPDGRSAALPFVEAVFAEIDRMSGVATVNDPEPFLVLDDDAPGPRG